MARFFSSKTRLLLPWLVFAGATLALALALHHLYRTAVVGIEEQAEKTVTQTRELQAEQNRRYLSEAQRSILTDLAGFHREGLEAALTQWDTANEIVIATFVAAPGGTLEWISGDPKDPRYGALVSALQKDFETWRKTHPSVANRDPLESNSGVTMAFATRRNPLFEEEDFRYQDENLTALREQGNTVDPWCVWFASAAEPDAPWLFWYRTGPQQPVRGCLIARKPLLEQLLQSFPQTPAAELSLAAEASSLTEANRDGLTLAPGYRLKVRPGSLFAQKSQDTRLTALLGVFLLLLFIGGGVYLAYITRKQRLEAAEKLTFVAQVSHELRTPLTSLRMFGDMLTTDGLSDEKRQRYARQISSESQRLGALIERLLSFNALAKGGAQITPEAFDVCGLLQEVVEETRARVAEAGKELRLEGAEHELAAAGDRSITKQALLNLLENACRHSGEGAGICIQVLATDKISIAVSDEGPGLTPQVKARLFEPFVQGGTGLTNKTPGLGLGLSLSRGWLRRAGADLVHVPTATGARFEIHLPHFNLSGTKPS